MQRRLPLSRPQKENVVVPQKTKQSFFTTTNKGWTGACVVAASGPSLNESISRQCRAFRTIAVNDAWRLFPHADVLYACDARWWRHHNGVPDFKGEKWSSHSSRTLNNKVLEAAEFRLKIVEGFDRPGFGYNGAIHYGQNSGFQAINLAILFGATYIVLVGFDMRIVDGKKHFFGEHPWHAKKTSPYRDWFKSFDSAVSSLPDDIKIINCTPNSALHSFKRMTLDSALSAAPRL